MGKRTVRVDIIPLAEPLLKLGTDIRDRHTALGGNSPLNNSIVDMILFANVHQAAKDKRKEAIDAHNFGYAAIQAADIALGKDSTQNIDTPGTVYYYTGRFRSQLLLAYQGREEEINTFGYNVVITTTGKKKNIKIKIPIQDIPAMERLSTNIIERHTNLGANSPLNNADVGAMAIQLQVSINKRKEGNGYHSQAEAAMQNSNKLLGIDKGQTVNTEGTVYYMINRIKGVLLLAYQGIEEEISTFGFNVVISTGGTPTPTIFLSAVTSVQTVFMEFIATTPAGGNITADYGDGTTETKFVAGNGTYTVFTHTFATPGPHTITFSGDLIALGEMRMINNELISLAFPDSMWPRNITASYNQLVTFTIHPTFTGMMILKLDNNHLTVDSINALLIAMNIFGTSNGTIDLSGGTNAAPTGQGIAAMNQLLARGWTVITN